MSTAPPWSIRTRGLAIAIVLGAGPALGEEPTPEEPPFESEGELAFHLDLSAYRGAEGATDQEIYVAVSNDQLAFREEETGQVGDLLLEVDVRTPNGEPVASLATELQPQAGALQAAEDRGILQVIRERVTVPPGLYQIQVTLTDRSSQKVGLLNRMRKVKNRGRLTAWIQVPAFRETGLSASDLTLVRSARPAPEGARFGRGAVDFDPNPARFYGLVLSSVKYFQEVYGGQEFVGGDTFLVHAQVTDGSGFPITERRIRVAPQAEPFSVTDEIPLDDPDPKRQVAAGRYRLAVLVMNERTREAVRTERSFEVMWSVSSWGYDPERMMQEMALVMTDQEYDTLERLSPGAREVYLSEFWYKLDPTPDTPENELFDRFRERVRLADGNFAQTLRRGILTDRGRVLVRYGSPDDVNWEYSASGFGPGAGGERVAEPGERADLSSRPSTSFLTAEEFREGDVGGLSTQRGGATIKSKALEIWSYDGKGDPLRPEYADRSITSHRGLKFIFADEMGNGEYQLVGSEGAVIY